jgi:hypothetical protein
MRSVKNALYPHRNLATRREASRREASRREARRRQVLSGSY